MFSKTAKLTENSPLQDAVACTTVVSGAESLVTLETKLKRAASESANLYQSTILEYVVEWEAIVTKKIDSELKYTSKVHKNLKHYASKLEKLRKTVAAKEEKGKGVAPQLSQKLARNEDKLTESWKEYEETATRTCHLIEEATQMGWKDLYPLIQAMLTFERQRDEAEHALWSSLASIQNKVTAAVDAHDTPLPASAFNEVVVLTRPTKDEDSSEEEEEEEQLDAESEEEEEEEKERAEERHDTDET